MGLSVSSKRQIANVAYYGGGTLLGASVVALLVTKITGLDSRLSQAGIRHSGKLLVASSLLCGSAFIIGLIYRRRLGESQEEPLADGHAAPDRTPLRGDDRGLTGRSTGWARGVFGPFSLSKSFNHSFGGGGSKTRTIIGPDGDIEVKRQGDQTEIRASRLRYEGRTISSYSWSGTGQPRDAVGRYVLELADRGSSESSDRFDESFRRLDAFRRPGAGHHWGPGRRLRG